VSEPLVDDLAAERAAVDAAVRAYIAKQQEILGTPDGEPVVQGWAVAVEWISLELADARSSGRDLISPWDQMSSTTTGLHHFGARRTTDA
jgi:hypothetical protein